MERKALGRGISALIPAASAEEPGSKIIFLQLEQVRTSPFQPRENFAPEEMQELVQSIKEKGVIQPILVRTKDSGYELIAGERRLRAAKSLNLKEIPAIVKDVADRDSLELALIENLQRQGLNPIEEARAYQYLMEKFGLTQEEISEVLGKARATVANTLRLLKLPLEIQEEIKKQRISFAHGRALLEIDDANLQRRLVHEIISRALSVRELENMLRARRSRSAKVRSHTRTIVADPYLKMLEAELQQILATKVRIVKKKKRGQILLEFYSDDDLQRLVAKLRGEVKV